MNIKLSSLNKGLVGHWTMSQDSLKGSLLADKTPYSNDGTIYGATFATDRMGQPNKAMSFDGVDDYVKLGNFDLTGGQRSISVWVNSKNMPSSLSDRRFFSGNYFDIKFTNGNLEAWIYDTSFKKLAYSASSLNSNNWYNVVITINNNDLKMYVDGVLRNQNNTFTLTNHPYNLNIGSNYWGERNHFAGLIDDVRIYNRVLSQAEIKTLYNSYNPNIKMKTSLPKIKLYGGDKDIK